MALPFSSISSKKRPHPVIDAAITARIIYLLVKPFKEWRLYDVGTIDENGKIIIPVRHRTLAQKPTYLELLVRNLKRLLKKLPGGDSKLKNLVAAMFLVKENYGFNNSKLLTLTEQDIQSVAVDKNDPYANDVIKLWKEATKKLEEDGGGMGVGAISSAGPSDIGDGHENGLPANNTKGVAIADFPLNNSLARRKRRQQLD